MGDAEDLGKIGALVTGELLRAAGDDPKMKAAGGQVASAALTTTKFINNALLPLAAINYGFERARRYFSEQFAADMGGKVEEIPREHLVDPKPSIAGPALQALAFAHEEPDLKQMYLDLLAAAMDTRRAHDAHPAYVEIIRQLTAEEAPILRSLLRSKGAVPIVEVRLQHVTDRTWEVLQRHVVDIREGNTKTPKVNPRHAAMIDNWIRLGLIQVSYQKHSATASAYDVFDSRPEVLDHRSKPETPDRKVVLERGMIELTTFGLQFARVVGILERR